jgi:hypothetical protein
VPIDRGAGPGEARLIVELREVGSQQVVGRAEVGKLNVKAR